MGKDQVRVSILAWERRKKCGRVRKEEGHTRRRRRTYSCHLSQFQRGQGSSLQDVYIHSRFKTIGILFKEKVSPSGKSVFNLSSGGDC